MRSVSWSMVSKAADRSRGTRAVGIPLDKDMYMRLNFHSRTTVFVRVNVTKITELHVKSDLCKNYTYLNQLGQDTKLGHCPVNIFTFCKCLKGYIWPWLIKGLYESHL